MNEPQISPEARVEMLEEEVDRLRRQLRALQGIEHDPPPWFNPTEFRKVVGRLTARLALLWLIGVPIMFFPLLARFVDLGSLEGLINARILEVPVFNFGGAATRTYGIGIGLFAAGGLAIGAVAIGGGAIGGLAIGGGACGIIAHGGGAVGVIAIGGGAVGYIAIGGSAYGRYALAHRAHGRAALGLNRQDEEAVAFFRRWVPGLSRAVTTPMQVLPVRRA